MITIFKCIILLVFYTGVNLDFSFYLKKKRHIEMMMMEAASTSETSVNVYQTTRRNNPEDSHLRLLNGLIKLVHPIVF
jgi:hypothetical protein